MKATHTRIITVEMNPEEAKNVLSLLTCSPTLDDKEEGLTRNDLKNVLNEVLTHEDPPTFSTPTLPRI